MNCYVYIMASSNREALYIGVTSDLERRVAQHKSHFFKGSFSDKYNTVDLVYYEECGNIDDAIAREKQLKGWSRKKKDALIASMNPELRDLAEE